jgi:hypothetical protein
VPRFGNLLQDSGSDGFAALDGAEEAWANLWFYSNPIFIDLEWAQASHRGGFPRVVRAGMGRARFHQTLHPSAPIRHEYFAAPWESGRYVF